MADGNAYQVGTSDEMSPTPLIEVRGLYKNFQTDAQIIEVLKGVDFDLDTVWE